MSEGAILVAGLKITKARFPHLYQIAQENPVMLIRQLRELAQVQNPTQEDLWSAAAIFEHDLEHDSKA